MYRISVEDNGPGIVRRKIPEVFGRLLYGSRFHAVRQSRGQQGIGISGVVMYAQLTTAKPAIIISKVEHEDVAHEITLFLDVKRNRPEVVKEEVLIWKGEDGSPKKHGTRVTVDVKGRYIKGKQSVYEYLKGTAIVNPHARITFTDPEGNKMVFERMATTMPRPTVEIKPHPHGIELGTFLSMLKETRARHLYTFLATEFSSVSTMKAKEVCAKAGMDPMLKPGMLSRNDAAKIMKAFAEVRLRPPDTNCLSPIGEELIRKGLKHVLGGKAEYYTTPITRPPKVYSGNPFQVEVGIVYGGDLPKDRPVEILRFANKVPLLYQAGACAITKAISSVDWRRYGLDQRGGEGIPYGPAIILVHVASTKIPYTSEAKEAIAPVPEIVDEIVLALQKAGRMLKTHLSKKKKRGKVREKFELVQEILPEIAGKSAKILNRPVPNLVPVITKIMNVVWIKSSISCDGGVCKLTINTVNYTGGEKELNLYTRIPREVIGSARFAPEPDEKHSDGRIGWRLRVKSGEMHRVEVEMYGVESDEISSVEVYFDGINPVHVIGAEPLPGDWGIESLRVKKVRLEGGAHGE
ncbi:MAG: DNA topoisomerase VI subunit B [Thermoplasmata archaeon]|nr:MAG: DNA topoisomerase VI subunit B [Thermoplasmata archaeon]